MVSIRTAYREKRKEMLKECIILLIDMLGIEKQALEKVKLPFFKRLKKTIETRSFERIKA
jgi:hypothetical protein